MNTITRSRLPTLRRMRTQIALLVAAIAAAGAAELIVSTSYDRDEAYWKSSPAPEDVSVAAGR